MPALHRLLSSSMNVTDSRLLVTFTFVGPRGTNAEDSKVILLGLWLAECKNSTYYCMYNIETKEVSLTKVTATMNRDMDTWGSFLHRHVAHVDHLKDTYITFLKTGKAHLKDHLGVAVNPDDQPSWIKQTSDAQSSSLLVIL